MLVNDLITSAYQTYADVQHIINIITDNDYISVTELSELLNKVLATTTISPMIINKLLLDKHFITKTKKQQLVGRKKLGLKPSKFIPTLEYVSYSKKRYCNDFSFYLWKFDIMLPLFNIDFKNQLDLTSAKKLCKVMNKYVFTRFDTNIVFLNLVKLQLILNYERGF